MISPYRRTNHALSHLYHGIQCRPCPLPGPDYEVSRAKDWISVDCGTIQSNFNGSNTLGTTKISSRQG